jgi:GH35 family endo-1,4-beta-xylanase
VRLSFPGRGGRGRDRDLSGRNTQPHGRAARRAIAAFAVCAAVGASGAAAQADTFIGVVNPFTARCGAEQKRGDCLSSRDLRRMARTHMTMVRWGFRWAIVQPTRGAYQWQTTDSVIGAMASRGIRVLPVMTGTPPWAGRSYGTAPVNTRVARDGWRSFLQAAVRRYGPGGRYWSDPNLYPAEHPDGAIRPIQTWQIWNEPNIRHGAQQVKPAKYVRLVKMSHDAIGHADPKAKIILAGMPGYVATHAWVYLNKLYRRQGFKRDFDGVALHPYAPDVNHVLVQIRRMRLVMTRHHDAHTPLWITELGWGSKRPSKSAPINKGPRGQKALLKATFPLLRQYHKRWNIRHAFWFRWRDPPRNSRGCTFCTSSGLFHHNQKPKPAWRAFKRITR